MTTWYLGEIVEIVDRLTYEIKVSIDGIVDKKPAFPFRCENDEPHVGDFVICKNIDPVYQSMYLYQKLKEDEFVGFRSNGKAVDVTPQYIEMRVYKFDEARDSQAAHDEWEQPKFISRIQIDKEGHIYIDTRPGNVFINIDGNVEQTITGNVTSTIQGNVDSTVEGNVTSVIKGNAKIEVGGKTDLDSSGPCTITSPKTTLTDLKAIPGTSGSLNCVPVCPFTGVKHYLDFGIK